MLQKNIHRIERKARRENIITEETSLFHLCVLCALCGKKSITPGRKEAATLPLEGIKFVNNILDRAFKKIRHAS